VAVRVRVVRAGILRNIDVVLPGTGVTLVLGPNGAGKTTLLKLIAGLIRGRAIVEVNGVRLDRLPPEERRVGYVPQNLGLFRHMTVYDNIAYGLRARGFSEREVAERVEAIAERLGIAHLLNRMPWSLSGGEAQRVALARILVLPDLRIMLLDEAFDRIDPDTRRKLLQLASLEAERRSIPVLLVTHHPREALEHMDVKAVLWLERGRLVRLVKQGGPGGAGGGGGAVSSAPEAVEPPHLQAL
jgi:ABC-type sugar transport system ATPase subunit